MKRRGAWSNRYAFYLATIGSAFSLGNLWRFPYVADSNGGGAFVVTYILLCLTIGLPIVIGELMLGKISRLSIISAADEFATQSPVPWIRKYKPWKWVAIGANLSSIFLLSFYSVICGWVLFFFMQYVVHIFSGKPLSTHLFDTLMNNGWLQVGLMSAHLLITTTVVSKGLKQGIEKLSTLIMPLFMALMIYLVAKSLSLPGTVDAIRFLFYPNFSYFTKDTLLKVLGHVFFTLSVGMGAMVAFGSYLRDDTYVPRAGFKVAVLDITISIFSGFLIFPIIFTANINGDYGPSLIFNTLSVFFDKMGLGMFFGLIFFLCLYLAALGASIMLLETSVSHLIDSKRFDRVKASWSMVIFVFIVALPAALSSTALKFVNIQGLSVLRLYDKVLIDYMLPVICLGICIFIGYGVPKKKKEEFFIVDDEMDSHKLYRNWHFIMRWLAPAVIIIGFLANMLGNF